MMFIKKKTKAVTQTWKIHYTKILRQKKTHRQKYTRKFK